MSEVRGSGENGRKSSHFHSGLVSSPVFKQGGSARVFWTKTSTTTYVAAENCIPFDYGSFRHCQEFRYRRDRVRDYDQFDHKLVPSALLVYWAR